MAQDCEGVKTSDGLMCRTHNVLLQQRSVQEVGLAATGATDMKAWHCPISGQSVLFNAAMSPEMFSS
jgi:hypothetical protein